MRVQEQASMLFLTFPLHPGTRTELFSPALLEYYDRLTEAMHRIVMPLLKKELMQGRLWVTPDMNRSPNRKWSILVFFFLISCDHPDPELWNSTNYIHSCRETECELNFRSIQASLHPRKSSCFQFCIGTLYWEAEGSVFRKVIGIFWSFLWGNNCSVTSLCFYTWANLWERNRFFLWNQETVFSQWAEITFSTCTPLTLFQFLWFLISIPLCLSFTNTNKHVCAHAPT